MTFWLFANVGTWYHPQEDKPNRNSAAFSYAAWLLDSHSREFADRPARPVKKAAGRPPRAHP